MRILSADMISYRIADRADVEPVVRQIQPGAPVVFEPAPPPPSPDLGQVPFRPVAYDEAQKALHTFHDERRAPRIGIDVETALPAFLYGDLAEPEDRDFWEASAAFLHQHEVLLSGIEHETTVQPARGYRWQSGIAQVEWRQTNSAGVPVYGAAVTLTYTGGRLTFLANTLHSARIAELNAFTWDETWPERLAKLAAAQEPGAAPELPNLPEQVRPVAFELPWDLRRESAERGWLADRWIMPFLPQRPLLDLEALPQWLADEPLPVYFPGPGVYRPIWRTAAVAEDGTRWLLFVDAETYTVLTVERTRVGVSLDTQVYPSAAAAAAGAPSLETLHFGAGADIAHADHVALSGARLADPAGVSPADTPAMAANRLLTATAFYQARLAQDNFAAALADLVLDAAVVLPPPGAVDPTGAISVALDDADGGAECDFQTRTLHFGRGRAAIAGATPAPAVHDPGLDGDVMTHELSHAVARFLKSVVFEYRNHNNLKEVLTRQLDEGLGFYFGGSFAGSAQWAQYAFGDWGALRDLTAPDLRPASAPPDPFGSLYQLGMWWARVFWALRADPAIQADKLILKAAAGLAGPLTSPAVMLHALLDPSEQYGPLSNVRAVLQRTGFAL